MVYNCVIYYSKIPATNVWGEGALSYLPHKRGCCPGGFSGDYVRGAYVRSPTKNENSINVVTVLHVDSLYSFVQPKHRSHNMPGSGVLTTNPISYRHAFDITHHFLVTLQKE